MLKLPLSQHTKTSDGLVHAITEVLDTMEISGGSFGCGTPSLLLEVHLVCDKTIVINAIELSGLNITCISCIQHL